MAGQGSDLEAWERQPGETARAYAQFVIYRDLRTSRSLVNVERQEGGKNRSYLSRLSARHTWVARAEAFDRYEARLLAEAAAEDIRKMGRRHQEIAERTVEVLDLPFRALAARLHSDPTGVLAELTGLPTPALVRLAKTIMPALAQAVDMERTSRGEVPLLGDGMTEMMVEQSESVTLVEIPDDPDRLAEVARILADAGALDISGGEAPPDAQADAVHSAQADT